MVYSCNNNPLEVAFVIAYFYRHHIYFLNVFFAFSAYRLGLASRQKKQDLYVPPGSCCTDPPGTGNPAVRSVHMSLL